MKYFPVLVLAGILGLAAAATAFGQKGHAPSSGNRGGRARGKATPASKQTGTTSTSSRSSGTAARPARDGKTAGKTVKDGKARGGKVRGGARKMKGGRPRPKKLSPGQRQRLRWLLTNNTNLSGGEKAAVGRLLSGESLSSQDRDALSSLLVSSNKDLTAEDREAISQGLSEDLEGKKVLQTRRYLKVHNDTGETLTVWVQYLSMTSGGEWAWFPTDPREGDKALAFQLQPGAVASLTVNKQRISAKRVRIWAQSKSGSRWGKHRTEDLWLVQEEDGGGEHQYYAVAMETHTHTFTR